MSENNKLSENNLLSEQLFNKLVENLSETIIKINRCNKKMDAIGLSKGYNNNTKMKYDALMLEYDECIKEATKR
jgi:hypothetical protein